MRKTQENALFQTLRIANVLQRKGGYIKEKQSDYWGWPSAIVVKCARSASAAQGSGIRIPGMD